VAQPCSDSFPLPPGPSHADPVRDLAFLQGCRVEERDSAGRETLLSCGAPQNTTISYDEAGRVVGAILAEEVTAGEQLHLWSYAYEPDGRMAQSSVERRLDGVVTAAQAVTTTWQGAVILGEEVRWTFDESFDQGTPEESGNSADPRFSDSGIERTRELRSWDGAGRMLVEEIQGGASAFLARRVVWSWGADGRLLGVEARHDVGDRAVSQEGCQNPEPGILVCTAELEYDEAGELVGFVAAGVAHVVSDRCCDLGCAAP
jgi:hypothetical protein